MPKKGKSKRGRPMKGAIRVGHVDGSGSALKSVRRALADSPDMCLANSWPDAESAMPSLLKDEVDLLLLGVELSGMSGIECLEHLRRMRPQLKVIMTAKTTDAADPLALVRASSYGLLVKPFDVDKLVDFLRQVIRGRTVFCPRIRQRVLDACLGIEPSEQPPNGQPLSPREREVLQLLAEGYTDKQIAEILGVKPNTEKEYVKKAYKKLGVHSRVQAVRSLGGLE